MLGAVGHDQAGSVAGGAAVGGRRRVAGPAAAHAVVAAAVDPPVRVGEGALVPARPVGPAAVDRGRGDRARDNVLLPVGHAGIAVGGRGALLLVAVPAAVRVHGVQTVLLGDEPSQII